jgi:uncharacterized repeat protein (TIGR01451 family)
VLSGTQWTHPWWARPYVTITVGTSGSEVTLGIIGLDTDSTPSATIAGATEGLAFKELAEAVLHYYDAVMAQSDGLILLAHQGTHDFGTYKGLKTVAQELLDAGKPLDLIIGGHQHEALYSPEYVGDTAIIEAGSYGHWLGRADVTVDLATRDLTLDHYELITITTAITPDQDVANRVAYWADLVDPLVQRLVGSTYIELTRAGADEWNLGNMVTDGMRWKADQLDDGQLNGSVEVALTNTGGLREDIVIPSGATLPYTITWGDTFNVMPFGNTLYLMDLTGAQLQAFVEQQAASPGSMMQISGAAFSYYNDCSCSSPSVWGSYGVQVQGQPLEYGGTYRIVTNNFSADVGILAEATDRLDTYYDMHEGVNEYIATISPIDSGDIMMGRMTKLDAPQPSLVSSYKDVLNADDDGVAEAAEVLTYTIVLSNTGDYQAGLLLTDTLHSGLTYVDGSLQVEFPGVGFVAEVAGGVLTAHTDGYLSPPLGGALQFDQEARITFAAEVDEPAPLGDYLSNTIELRDQFAAYHISPAVIVLPPGHSVFLPVVLR